jgi:quinol monooxygenase YgiN
MKERIFMIIVKIAIHALLEKQEEIQQTLLAINESMKNEKGCRNYQVFRNIKDKTSFGSIGEFDTREELYIHLKSDKFGVLLGTRSLLSTPIQIQILTVSLAEGTDLINTLRSNNLVIAAQDVQKRKIKKYERQT